MFGIVGYKMFLLSGILLNLTPGSDTVYILTRAGVGGRKKGIASALGISTGILIHTVLAALGLSVILAKSAALFNAMKLAGAVYLAVMGIKTILSKDGIISHENNQKDENIFKVYRQGVLTNALNPKVALFFLALLPQFVSPENTYGPLPFLILGFTFFCTGTIWCTFLAYVASFISNFLQKNDKVKAIASKATGVIYILLGLNVLRAKME